MSDALNFGEELKLEYLKADSKPYGTIPVHVIERFKGCEKTPRQVDRYVNIMYVHELIKERNRLRRQLARAKKLLAKAGG